MSEFLHNVIYGEVTWFNLITAFLIIFLAMVLSKILSINLRRSFKDKMMKENLELIAKVVTYGILAIALMWVLPTLGLELSGLLVAGGVLGLAIGFASQSIIGNLVSGLFLMVERPVKIGDFIEVSGNMGVVEDIQIISTTVRTLDGPTIRIPNEMVFTSSITNYTSIPVRRFEYEIGISYADDAELAIQIIKDIIKEHPLVLLNPPSQVYVDGLGDNSVDIIVRIWSPSSAWFSVKMELLWKMKKAIEAAGIEIPFPQRVVWQGDKGEKSGQD